MLRSGYWVTAFISISRVLKNAPAAYSRAFLLSETDDNDCTYFILHQLGIICRAIAELHKYLERKVEELRGVERFLRASSELNHRQRDLLAHALRHPDATYTINAHRATHGVVHQTARTDLLSLAEKGLLEQRRVGKGYLFVPAKDLERRLRRA